MTQDSNTDSLGAIDPEVDIDFFVLLRYLRESRRFILICGVLAAVITAIYLRNATPLYEASMVVAPMGQNATDGVSGAGLQSLTSVLSTLGGGASNSPQFDQFQYKVTSPSVVHAANADGKLYAWLYPNLWHAETRTWTKPHGTQQVLLGIVRTFFHEAEWTAPDEVMASEALKRQIGIEPIPKSTLVRISYEHRDRTVAVAMLSRLFSEADRQIRDQERRRLKAQIANANEVLATTQVSDYRSAMVQALATAQYRLMNVPDDIDYSARLVEAPSASSVPASPKIGLTLAAATIGVLLVSAFAAVGYRIAAAELARRGTLIPHGPDLRARDFVRFFLRRRPRSRP